MSLKGLRAEIRQTELIGRGGRITAVSPTHFEADGPNIPLGGLCLVDASTPDHAPILSQVVSLRPGRVSLVPLDPSLATYPGAKVLARSTTDRVAVGDELLGRALDALGRPIDGLGPLLPDEFSELGGGAANPMARTTSKELLETGVRAIDAALTLGRGQRVGVFAASGVGKTSLMNQLARQVKADRVVICLVGERGREVEALWTEGLPPETRARSTLIAATSDQTAAMRVRACDYALEVADYWRSQGRHVLLLIDSITRLALALREVGLAAGEPPTVRAFTPSVFAKLPRVVERCGALRAGGAITAIMTVLSETDDNDDPISEVMKSLLDGHIILSRALADQGHFPAIDLPRSISRLAQGLLPPEDLAFAQQALAQLSLFDSSRTLVESGIYSTGTNPDLDLALNQRSALLDFLRQPQSQNVPGEEARAQLAGLLRGGQ